jgi:hypothetical protein
MRVMVERRSIAGAMDALALVLCKVALALTFPSFQNYNENLRIP